MQQRQCEVCRQLESERGLRRASREASETDRSKKEWRRKSESRGTRLERDFSSLCCSRAAGATTTTTAIASPLLAALDRGMDPFNVCVDLIYDRLGPATVQGSSPFQINVSDHRQWVD